jgi:hypothetical protein
MPIPSSPNQEYMPLSYFLYRSGAIANTRVKQIAARKTGNFPCRTTSKKHMFYTVKLSRVATNITNRRFLTDSLIHLVEKRSFP